MKTFACNFGAGVSCTIKVSDHPVPDGESHVKECVWTGTKEPKHFRPYVYWMNSVNKQLADEWEVTIWHVYQMEFGRLEGWVFEPGKPPKRRDPVVGE